mmetsp:Transcript_39632/g.95774  ORF Transcript_39632/g.95774 Transcript_39632/m.95774 type:complete len:94 (+) Transcript_39632:451-732(+)|eukprot:CAMPEP_0113646294 /NCGR_PEP_ID=MMETSP0017_2-20120614/24446_1 /TAXON_ID=2856 /ORGANISM="Cylindrotheca closterium" /LENGTH=93 /DNA_ID=CAMNT_0000558165 /DNA_START=62 /DNA_END=343 /DNA_ORIENTATION=+ /assembly_acc=CAM_ASM_000147
MNAGRPMLATFDEDLPFEDGDPLTVQHDVPCNLVVTRSQLLSPTAFRMKIAYYTIEELELNEDISDDESTTWFRYPDKNIPLEINEEGTCVRN